jgi:hypothetical protein
VRARPCVAAVNGERWIAVPAGPAGAAVAEHAKSPVLHVSVSSVPQNKAVAETYATQHRVGSSETEHRTGGSRVLLCSPSFSSFCENTCRTVSKTPFRPADQRRTGIA